MEFWKIKDREEEAVYEGAGEEFPARKSMDQMKAQPRISKRGSDQHVKYPREAMGDN